MAFLDGLVTEVRQTERLVGDRITPLAEQASWMILSDRPAGLDAPVAGAETVDAGTQPIAGRATLIGVVGDQGLGQAPVPVAGGDRLEQVAVAVTGGHHTHRDRHAGQVRGGNLVVQDVDLRREFSNSCTSAKSLVRRLLRRVGKGAEVAREAPVTVFEDARGPNVRVLRQAQRRLSLAELEALIAEYEAGARVCELGKIYDLHRTTVARHIAGAGKTRPVMTEAQIDEAVVLYREGWTLHNLAQRLGVADQTIRGVLVERAVTIRPGGRRKVAAVA